MSLLQTESLWPGLWTLRIQRQKHKAASWFWWFCGLHFRGTDVDRGEEFDSLDFTCEAAAEESPDEDGDQSHVFDEEDFCVFCCDEGQLSVIQCSTLRTINSPRALEHGAADAKWLSMEMLWLTPTGTWITLIMLINQWINQFTRLLINYVSVIILFVSFMFCEQIVFRNVCFDSFYINNTQF